MRPLLHASIALAAFVTCMLLAGPAGASLLFESGYTSYYFRPIDYGSDVGDVNGDGHQDLVVSISSSGVIRTALGKGDGTFPTFKDSPIEGGYQGPIRLADFNGDSKLDLLIGGALGGDSVRVAFGQGDGTFGPPIRIASSYPANVFAGDVNADGKQDAIVLPASQPGHVLILLGHGDGTFAPPLDFPVGSIVGNLVLTDANQDGKPDLVMGFQVSVPPDQVGTDLGIALGNGDGTFGPVAHFGVYDAYAGLFAGDFNGDGKPDVITSDKCYFGSGEGAFGPATPVGMYVMGTPDLNGDGKPDLLGWSSTSYSHLTYTELENGDGTFQAPVTVPACLDEFWWVFADFNEDGHVDYAAGGSTIGTVFVHAGHGDGTFGSRMAYPTGLEPVALAVADLDGDGKPDVATANHSDASVSVLLGTGGGALGTRSDFAVGPSPRAIAAGDLNHDGKPDIVTASQTTASVSVLLNAGAGAFAAHVDHATGGVAAGLALGDFDEDGNLDVVVSDSTIGHISLLRGDGLGGLAAPVGFSTGAGPGPIAVGDINGDGHLDVVTYAESFSATTISVLLGDGQGHFSAPVSTSFPGVQIRAIALADLNHDGKIDAVASGRIVTTVLLGDGTGAFTPSPFFRLVQLRGLALADLDGDGNVDIAAASDWANCAWVTLGHGDGTFGDLVYDGSTYWDFAPGYGTETYVPAVAVADMNGDGPPDLVLSEADPYNVFNGVSVLLHVPNGPVSVPTPRPSTPHFALDGLRPNPARADLVASFTLAEPGPATLEMFDVSGRRVLSQSVGSLGLGPHTLKIQPAHPLAAGVYFLRLTQNRESLVTRACVIR